MFCCKINSRLLGRLTLSLKHARRHQSEVTVSANESSAQPQEVASALAVIENESSAVKKRYLNLKYPAIIDRSFLGTQKRKRQLWYNKIKNLRTVEEKIFELNMPKYYGWKLFKIQEGVLPYDPLPFAQYATLTHVPEEPGLPSYYDSIISPETLDSCVQKIKSQVEDALVFEYCHRKRDHQYNSDELENKSFLEKLTSEALSQDINRILINNLSPSYNHLLEAQVDIKPRVEAFWFFGGCEPFYEKLRSRKSVGWMRKYVEEPVNQNFQYYGSPLLHVRHNLPLKEILSLEDCNMKEVPKQDLDPRKLGYFMERTRATIVPGFWPGDHDEFGTLSYHSSSHLSNRPEHFNDNFDALKAQAVFGSFSWLYSQACYQGFSNFQDPTYPLVNQMIITDGKWWSFCVYQLNTTTLHQDSFFDNQRRNICWVTEPIKLFDSIEDEKVQNLNEDVLKNLIKFYANVPQVREGINMKPYLHKKELVIAGIENPERRIWLEQRYKHLISKRPRHRLLPEIHHWENIYKIKFNTRTMDTKREPWEFGIHQYSRRLDDHTPQYIPRAMRQFKKKRYPLIRNKFEKTYYPSPKR